MQVVFAGVMELADVTDSKSVGSDTVRVQVPSPAPKIRVHTNVWALIFLLEKVGT